jgi:hypothetical protein
LALWRHGLPESGSAIGRTEALISYLQNRENVDGENALGLFLQVSGDRLSAGDACRETLHELAAQLTTGEIERAASENVAQIFEVLRDRFSLDALKTLCFNLGMNYEELPGQTLSAKARELVRFFQQRNQLDQLQEAIEHFRPDIRFD